MPEPDVAELEHIVDKCLEKDRTLRYQHAADIRADCSAQRDTDSRRVSTRVELQPHAQPKRRMSGCSDRHPACRTAIVAGYRSFHPTPDWTNKDTIVLADFQHRRPGVRRHASPGLAAQPSTIFSLI
jgi:hypothetical protein